MKTCIKWAGTGEVLRHYTLDEHAGYGLREGDVFELPDDDTALKVMGKHFMFIESDEDGNSYQPRLTLYVTKAVESQERERFEARKVICRSAMELREGPGWLGLHFHDALNALWSVAVASATDLEWTVPDGYYVTQDDVEWFHSKVEEWRASRGGKETEQ